MKKRTKLVGVKPDLWRRLVALARRLGATPDELAARALRQALAARGVK